MTGEEELLSLGAVESLSYPFPQHGLSAAEAEPVERALREQQAQFGLFEDPQKTGAVVHGFACLCSIPAAAPESVHLVTTLLGLTLFFNDRVERDDCTSLLDQSLMALFRPQSCEGTAPSTRASLSLGQRLQPHFERSPELATLFKQATLDTWTAFRWESEHLGRLPDEQADYEWLRSQIIAVRPFVRCYQLLFHVPASVTFRSGQVLRRAEELSTRVQYLANDLGSVARDLAKGQRNAVVLEARRSGASLADSWQRVRVLHDETAASLAQLLMQARSREDDPAFQAYLDELEACTWGNLRALWVLKKRYQRVNPEL